MRPFPALTLAILGVLTSCSSVPSGPPAPNFGPGITLGSVQDEPTARIYELNWAAPSDAWETSRAYAVVPRTPEPGPGLVYFHLYGAGGGWGEFLEEALLAARQGVRSVLMVGRVPWDTSFDGTEADNALIDAQMDDLRRAVSLLAGLPGVDPSRLGLVGHDYGAMYGALLSAEATPISSFALVAAAPDFADWIGYFTRNSKASPDYGTLLGHRNPVAALKKAPGVRRFLQFTKNDIYITAAAARLLAEADPGATVDHLETPNHAQVAAEGAPARLQWLFEPWGMKAPGSDLVPSIAVAGPTGRYLLGTTEVTQTQWQSVMPGNPSRHKGANLPVEMVNWYEAAEFCNQLSRRDGLEPAYVIEGSQVTVVSGSRGWRFPTSAEWDWAARGGELSGNTAYAGSDDPEEVAWTSENSEGATHEVGQKTPNELGFFDMTGNVKEWCADTGADETTRVYRGGGWLLGGRSLKLDFVDDFVPVYHNIDLGFRVARTLP